MSHSVEVKGSEDSVNIYTPTDDFNLIFQMSHVLHHFFCEGIGLRHFIDYFYLLKHSKGIVDKDEIADLFEAFGLTRFASGVMWIEQEILGLSPNFLIIEPNKTLGEVIWKEILQYGNFNHEGASGSSSIQIKLNNTLKPLHYLLVFPGYTIDRLLFSIWLQWWKLRNL